MALSATRPCLPVTALTASPIETCCCNHGGRCTCCHKKDTLLDTVPESDSEGETNPSSSRSRTKVSSSRRRANTVHSDGVAYEQNPHHKSSKHARVSSKLGPYQLNRVNSANSAGSLCTDRESLGSRSRAGSSREQRRVKSETASPLMSSSRFPHTNSNLPPLDLSNIDYPAYVPNGSFDLFGSSGVSSEHDAPIYSAGLSAASVDWSHFDWPDPKGDNFAPSSYSQAGTQGYNGLFEFGSGSERLPRLANTTSTSGDVSEVEDFMPGPEGDYDGYGAGNGFLRQGLVENSADISSIDYSSFYKGTDVAGAGVSMVEEDPAFWIANYNEGMATMDEGPDGLAPASTTGYWDA